MTPGEVEAMPDEQYEAFVRYAHRELAETRRASRRRR